MGLLGPDDTARLLAAYGVSEAYGRATFYPPRDAPVVTIMFLTNPGARAQALPANMETAVVSDEAKRTLTRIEQCAADAAELPTLQASSGIAKAVLDMIDLIVTPSIGIGASNMEFNERSSPEAVIASRRSFPRSHTFPLSTGALGGSNEGDGGPRARP
jgi:hypothetical protein